MPVVGAELYVFSLYKLWMGVPLKTQRMESALYSRAEHSSVLLPESSICEYLQQVKKRLFLSSA